jgi:hypothetical protein
MPDITTEDQAVTESMGPVYKRWQEHLGVSDAMIIRMRRSLLTAARALAKDGIVPPGVDAPEVYRQRSGGVILPRSADWLEATAGLRQAFVEHPELVG